MGRRTVLLVVAAMIAVVGSGMVFLYVKSADNRAKEGQVPFAVLKAVAQIEPGETLADASAAGKIELEEVPTEQVLDGALDAIGDSGELEALTRIYPNEQVTSTKFGTPGSTDNLAMPAGMFAISVQLSDTGRVAGFVSPGAKVALFLNGPVDARGKEGTRLLLPEVQIVAVAQTTLAAETTPADGTAAQPAESLTNAIVTLAVDQAQAEKVMFASSHGELSFGLLNDQSKVRPSPGVTQANLFG